MTRYDVAFFNPDNCDDYGNSMEEGIIVGSLAKALKIRANHKYRHLVWIRRLSDMRTLYHVGDIR